MVSIILAVVAWIIVGLAVIQLAEWKRDWHVVLFWPVLILIAVVFSVWLMWLALKERITTVWRS